MDEEKTDSSRERTTVSDETNPSMFHQDTNAPFTEAVQSPISEDTNANQTEILIQCPDGQQQALTIEDASPENNDMHLCDRLIETYDSEVQRINDNSLLRSQVNLAKSASLQSLPPQNNVSSSIPMLHTILDDPPSIATPLFKAFSTDNVATDKVYMDKLSSRPIESIETKQDSKETPCIPVEHKMSVNSATSTRSYESPNYRPTLADDSRAVKIPLPANPINIMQTNAQFLNKGRNFLNFLSEKSSNIMEKALSSQQLSVKYNSVLKLKDSTYSEKKSIEDSSNSIASSLVQESLLQNKNAPSEKTIYHIDNHQSNSSCKYINQSDSVNNELNGLTVSNKNDQEKKSRDEACDVDETDNMNSIKNETKIVTPCSVRNGNISSESNDSLLNIASTNGDVTPTKTSDTVNADDFVKVDVECSRENIMHHPTYMTLLKEYAELKAKYFQLQDKGDQSDEKKCVLDMEKGDEIPIVQVEILEKTVNKLTAELRNFVMTQETLKKEYNTANKERESMVMKYAVGEKQLIDTQRARGNAERKVKELTKDVELLQGKLRQSQGERTRICSILDTKCKEVTELQKEVEKLKEDVKMRDVKLKWSQTKLKTEMDAQKETQQKLEKALSRINDMKEECEQVRKESEESIRKFQQSEENKAVTLDQQLKEQQAQLILERHVVENKEMVRVQLQKEVDILKQRQQILIEENNTLSLKVQDTEKNRFNYESTINNLKVIADQRQKEVVDLLGKVSQLETLKVELQHKDQILEATKVELENLKLANEELQNYMTACRAREADMLDFTQKLTDKNVRLQSEFTAMEARTKQLEEEHGPLRKRINELIAKVKALEESLGKEQKTRMEECEILAKHLAEQTQAAQNLAQKLEDCQGENAVLKRKEQLIAKELTRELQHCRKRLEYYETTSPCNSLVNASRAGSSASLNTGDIPNGALSDNSATGEQPIQTSEPSKQVLIDRILKLERSKIGYAEKLDFYEEHTRELVEELQRKTKIIRHYILHENFGAMGSSERDRNKAELARHGGIMASVYNQQVSDENMTLELSLEMNQKLQAVLEDVVLKNITLKDNIDTLGEEIARLTIQNQQRQMVK